MIVYGILIGLTVFVYLFFTALHYEKNKVDKITITFFFIGYLLLLCLPLKKMRFHSFGNQPVSTADAACRYVQAESFRPGLRIMQNGMMKFPL